MLLLGWSLDDKTEVMSLDMIKDNFTLDRVTKSAAIFDQDKLDLMRERQVDTVRYLEKVFEELYDHVPENTHIIVTADHGELFGEAGYFGHGPIMHEKCFEVPYLEGKVR